jgi:hypothetical protein
VSTLEDILAAIRQKMYANPYLQQPQPPTVGAIAGGGQSQQQQAPQMGGMAGQAQLDLKLHPLYVQYQIQQQSNGQDAMPYDAWKAQLLQQMQPRQ